MLSALPSREVTNTNFAVFGLAKPQITKLLSVADALLGTQASGSVAGCVCYTGPGYWPEEQESHVRTNTSGVE